MESTEKRFAHLLEPIKELTKNWEIDVASELNDYLEELDEMCITFDDGKTSVNFAQAALLIQGSACIYSKKVELLHSLVFQTLEYINNNKKKKKDNQAADSQDKGGEDDEGNGADEHSQFTDLEISPTNHFQKENSISTVNDVALPPECLIPQDTRAKQKLPLINLKGEILYKQKDFRLASLNPGKEEILLSLASSESRQPAEAHRQQQNSAADLAPQPSLQNDEAPVGSSAVNVTVDEAVAEDFPPPEENDMDLEPQEPQEPQEHIERQQAPSEGRVLRERRPVDTVLPRVEDLPPTVNVWDLHDPYAVFNNDKPFKSGKCYKVPEGLDDGGKRKRKQSVFQDFDSWCRESFCPTERKLRNGPRFIDLNYIYLNVIKSKMKTAKRIYKKAGLMISDEELHQTLLQPEEIELQRNREDQDDNAAGEDFDHDDFSDALPVEFGAEPHVFSPDQNEELDYESLVKQRVEQAVANSQAYTQETSLSRRVKIWEDQIKPVLAQQERRPVFDIHDYGDRIVEALGAVGRRRPFSSIVSGLDNFEACKYLLASLQLANDYNVELDSELGLQQSVDSVGLTLLSVSRATDRFKHLQASD